MTEEEWFRASDVEAMLRWLRNTRRFPKVSPRKLQLFGQTAAATVAELAAIPAAAEVIRVGEGVSEAGWPPILDKRDRDRLLNAIPDGWAAMLCRFLLAISNSDAWQRSTPEDYAGLVAHWARWRLGAAVADDHARALRDIVGNPFRPVAFSAEWRTSTAVAIARGMYESRDFSPMPILADALQDAGSDNDDILNHCRDPQGVHVRGCWVVDLVLGKS
jgi:hypothetical protein